MKRLMGETLPVGELSLPRTSTERLKFHHFRGKDQRDWKLSICWQTVVNHFRICARQADWNLQGTTIFNRTKIFFFLRGAPWGKTFSSSEAAFTSRVFEIANSPSKRKLRLCRTSSRLAARPEHFKGARRIQTYCTSLPRARRKPLSRNNIWGWSGRVFQKRGTSSILSKTPYLPSLADFCESRPFELPCLSFRHL